MLQTIQASIPLCPGATGCSTKPAPPAVSAALRATGEPGPLTLEKLIAACDQSHNLLSAVNAAGGLNSPQVQGLLAYNPLATAISKGRAGESRPRSPARSGSHSQNLASLLWPKRSSFRRRLPDRTSGSVGGGLPRWPGRLRCCWCLRCEVVGAPAAKRDFEAHERMVTEELAKMAATDRVRLRTVWPFGGAMESGPKAGGP